jgi:hypothetical protein
MKYPWIAAIAGTALATGWYVQNVTQAQQTTPGARWSAQLDAMAAAPNSHRVLLENERVRVLEVVVRPGEREPVHTHGWPSLMFITHPATLRYFPAIVLGDEVQIGTGEISQAGAKPTGTPVPRWLSPEGPHAVENLDSTEFRAIRVELKPEG